MMDTIKKAIFGKRLRIIDGEYVGLGILCISTTIVLLYLFLEYYLMFGMRDILDISLTFLVVLGCSIFVAIGVWVMKDGMRWENFLQQVRHYGAMG